MREAGDDPYHRGIRLGIAALVPAAGVLIFTKVISGWVKKRNLKSLQSLGGMSAEIQESLSNFKVIVAFNRADYFQNKFNEANERNFAASVAGGMARWNELKYPTTK